MKKFEDFSQLNESSLSTNGREAKIHFVAAAQSLEKALNIIEDKENQSIYKECAKLEQEIVDLSKKLK